MRSGKRRGNGVRSAGGIGWLLRRTFGKESVVRFGDRDGGR